MTEYAAMPVFPEHTHFLVTGGAGFIGSNICESLLKMGYRIRCLDDLSTGKTENLESFSGCDRFEFIKGDIRDFDTCMRAAEGVDYVLHHAAWGSVPRSIELPLIYDLINVHGTVNMMEAALRAGVKRFVYASSSAVYGDDETLPKVEEKVGRLLSPYALSKYADELYAQQYHMHYELATVGLRYFNVYGKRQDPEGAYAAVIPKFLKMMLSGERPIIFGDGTQTRDFVYVDDVVQANLRACLAPNDANGEAFNIAFGGKLDLNAMLDALEKALGIEVEPVYLEERAGDIKHSSADISKAKRVLRFAPRWDFEKGIAEAIEWYRENL